MTILALLAALGLLAALRMVSVRTHRDRRVQRAMSGAAGGRPLGRRAARIQQRRGRR